MICLSKVHSASKTSMNFVICVIIPFTAGPGSFLVRPSDNSPGDYSLFFHINNQIQRFRIEKKGVRYLMGGRTFNCLDAVINRYKTEQIVEGEISLFAI